MAKMYYDSDADSGLSVMVGLYNGSGSWSRAEQAGLKVGTVEEVAFATDVIMMLVPDQVQKQVYEQSVRSGLPRSKTLMFAHGFNIHFNQIQPPPGVDVSMVAPKAPGHMMRRLYTEGSGVPALLAVHQDVSCDLAPWAPP